jgi:hypothetical protein
MDFNHIKKVANSLSKLIDDSERVALPVFASKLAKASEEYPEDRTIGIMADITARMAGSKKLFITRAEIKDLYNRLYSRNTKFAELFQNELGQVEKLASSKIYNRENDDSGLDVINKAYDKVVDPVLANALNNAFGNKSKGYTDTAANAAESICKQSLSIMFGKITPSTNIVAGNPDAIICRASFETPKGAVSIYVPIEIIGGKVLMPSIFIGNNGSEDFSKSNIEQYIVANAGNKLNISENIVLQAVEAVKAGSVSDVSGVDLALTKLNSKKETKSEYFSNGVLFQKVAEEDKNLTVGTPAYKDAEIESFAKEFDSSIGVAKFKFGEDKVKLGRLVISNKLNNLGIDNHQISVFNSDNSQIIYAVSLNDGRVAFRVPVKISNNKVLDPTILISNGAIESFSKEGLASLFNKETTDYKTAAVASPLYGLKASELVQAVREAVVEENYAKAEDALNILSQSGDDKAYQTAFSEYANGLNLVKVASGQETACNMIVKNSSSKHSLCGHTGLPVHKVYQDKNGDCHPLYRRGMEDTREGAYFLNSKIFF